MATPTAHMANSRSSDNIDQEYDKREKQTKRHKKNLKRDIKAALTALEKQEARLSQLQSSAFQLANYYFVFQGVILTALCNRNTALRCSDRWLLATLSALAAALNLAALVSIGDKYNRMVTQQARTWTKCNELQTELSNIEEQEKQRQQFCCRNLSGISSRAASLDAASSVLSGDDNFLIHTYSSSGHVVLDYVDTSAIRKRQFYFGVCILIFLAFAIIVFVGCLKIPCRVS